MNSDTIVAPATPHGLGGIAVVRLSGDRSQDILHKLINNNSLGGAPPQRTHLLNLYDAENKIIDEAVVTYFKNPRSYTGEDVVEFSVHGNPLIVEHLVETCVFFGARLAEPGEFTQRAFLNGKMDLVQAEAVASLIHSRTLESGQLNLRLLSGELSEKLNQIRDRLISAASIIEYELDISEDEPQQELKAKIRSDVDDINLNVKDLLGKHENARLLNKGAKVVIAGRPNVGKSTLLNALSGYDRAITSETPGTTRDTIDVSLIIDGVPISLFDTAGIRASNNELEAEGVRRSLKHLENADLILLVRDINSNLSDDPALPGDIPRIKILNKIDLAAPAGLLSNQNVALVSAKTGSGLKELKNMIKDILGIGPSLSSALSITSTRQKQALSLCQKNLVSILELLNNPQAQYELISIELNEALDNIGLILGKTTPDDILKNIFSNFCVGK